MNKSNLRMLLDEFLDEETAARIEARADDMELVCKVKKMKGRWNRETLRKLIKERGDACSYCHSKGKEIKLTLDHIIPKSMLLDMGLEEYYEDENNLEILCRECNIRKASKLDFSNPKTVVQLEKYIKLCKERRAL